MSLVSSPDHSRRLLFRSVFLAVVSGIVCSLGQGCSRAFDEANYPEKTITIICPWAAGGGTDQVSRQIADQLQQRLDSPVIVVNRDGGSGAIGHMAIANADPDGYTLGTITAELSTMHEMGICPETYRDYQCLMQVNADAAAVIVRQEAPWKNLMELLDAIRTRPGELKMSGTATGGLWDLARVGMLEAAGLKPSSVVWVPTKGSAPSVVQLLGGHIEAVCCSVPEVAAQLQAGELRVLAVLSEKRLPDFPDLPTAKEQGLNWVAMGWRGLALPKHVPPSIVKKLETELREIMASDEYREFMQKRGFGIEIKGPREFEAFLAQQENQWKQVLQSTGYTHLDQSDPGPYTLPIALGVVLGIGGLFQLGSWWISRKASHSNRNLGAFREISPEKTISSNLNVGMVLAAIAAYLLLMPWIGFSLTTIGFAGGLIWWFGSRWWVGGFTAVVLTVLVQIVFAVLFKVQLPAGELRLPF